MALHQSYIIGKFIMLHVRLLNFIFGKLYHVQNIAAYRATVRDVITQYKSLLHGKLSRYECVPYLSHNSPRITECVQCMPQINVLTLYGIPILTKLASSKCMVKLESDIWSNSNMWSKLLSIWSKAKYMVKFYMIKLKYMVKRKLWSFFPYMVKHAANIWSKFKKIPFIIVTDMTYLLVNWTDVTSTESAFANKIRDPARAQTYTHDPYLM